MNSALSWQTILQNLWDRFGENLDELTLIRAANRVLDDLKAIVNLPTQKRTTYVPYIYDCERYSLPDDFKTEGLIGLYYQNKIDNNRNRTFVIYEPPFGLTNVKWNFISYENWLSRDRADSASINADKGIETLFLANGKADQTKTEISTCDSLTGWTGAGGISNLTLDSNVKIQGDYSINFDLASSTAATLTLALTAVDLSDYINNGVLRFNLWLPTSPTSIEIRIGSDSSNYYTQTITTQNDGSSFDNIYDNEISLSFKDAITSGTPTSTVITYFAIILNFALATTDTDFRIDNINVWQPENLILEYYSYYMVKSSAGVWQEYLTETAGTEDIPNILNEWRNILELGIMIYSGELDSDSRMTVWRQQYGGIDPINGRWFGGLGELQRKYQNKAKKIGTSWW